MDNSIGEIYNFTYNQLGISTFLIPAIYQKLFSNVFWFFPKEETFNVGSKKLYVRTYKEEGKLFISGPDSSPWPDEKPWQDKVFYEIHHKTLSHDILNVQNAILDIDLDYFSCEIYINTVNKAEVTAREYKKFMNNKYHFLRLKGNCYAESSNGSYYIHMNSNESNEVVTKAKLTNEEILKKIDLFCKYLKKNKIKPLMINISRSRISGYTPGDQCDFIEKSLIKGLKSIYEIRRFYINDMKEFKNIK
jgi:hypothetical protein